MTDSIHTAKDAADAARHDLGRAAVAYASTPPERQGPAMDALCFAASIYARRQGSYLQALKVAKRAHDAMLMGRK